MIYRDQRFLDNDRGIVELIERGGEDLGLGDHTIFTVYRDCAGKKEVVHIGNFFDALNV